MVNAHIIHITDDNVGLRIDKVICQAVDGMSRSAVQKIIDDGNVSVGDTVISKNYKTRAGDIVRVVIHQARELEITAEDIPLDIRYEDCDLLVVNKPKGMVVHPAAGNYDGTLVNALMHHCKGSLSGVCHTLPLHL